MDALGADHVNSTRLCGFIDAQLVSELRRPLLLSLAQSPCDIGRLQGLRSDLHDMQANPRHHVGQSMRNPLVGLPDFFTNQVVPSMERDKSSLEILRTVSPEVQR